MPPVLGPVSPSPIRLWSCAAPSSRASVPSQSANSDTSSPRRHSSITTDRPAAPRWSCRISCSIAASASASVPATTTPLPAANPSALTTSGAPRPPHEIASAASASSNRSQRGPGTPAASATSRAKLLLPSSRAAAAVGPAHAIPAAAHRSAMPATSAASGPGTTRSIASACAKATSASASATAIATFSPQRRRPRIAGGDEQRGHGRRRRQSGGERVLPTAMAHQQNPHRLVPPVTARLCYGAGMDTKPGANVPEYSVSELSGAVKRTLEDSFGRVRVRGEVTELKRYPSGHVYLSLKDEGGKIAAVVWRGAVARLGLAPRTAWR